MKTILVVSEQNSNGNLHINYEMLGKANELAANNGAEVVAVCFDDQDEKSIRELEAYGAKKVIVCQCKHEQTYLYYSEILISIINMYQAELVLFAGTPLGKRLSSTVSTGIGAGLVADCINIYTDDEYKYVFARAAMSSSIIAKIVCAENCVQICTVKKNVFKGSVKKDNNVKAEKVYLSFEIEDPCKDSIKVISKEDIVKNNNYHLESANLIFGVGRGVSREDIDKVKELAQYYNAEFAGTRPMTEENIIVREQQIGQSGVSVRPKVYVAFGISGASQHMVGLSSATIVIAINKDEKSAIFDSADYKIVADTHDVIEKLYKNIKR